MVAITIFLTLLFIISTSTSKIKHIVGGKASKSKMDPYIIGGKNVKIKQFPHSLYLYMEPNDAKPHVCGGSILTQHILLTVAHCFEGCEDGVITAYAGHENIEKMTASREISSFEIHKDYNTRYLHSDIALGHTKKPWKLNKLKRVIIISKYFPVKEAMVAGWGVTNDITGEQQTTLKAVTQHIQPSEVCKTAGSRIVPGTLCATNYKNQPSHGDSGSAFVLNNGHQIGAVSWRSRRKKELVVYTNITFYYDWIRVCSRRLQCLNKS